MNPYFFGSKERRLFGIHEAPQRSSAARGAVLCSPLGTEYIHAHRAMRQLAKMLTAEGVHTFRFDYFGTGDSDGDTRTGSFAGWEGDIQSAITELTETIGSAQISLVGLRLGASLAANVAIRENVEVSSLVLWDPVVSGSEYLAEIRRAAWKLRPISRFRLTPSLKRDRGKEIIGFPLTPILEATLEQFSLGDIVQRLPERTLFLTSQALESHADLRRKLDQRNAPLVMEHIDSPPGWVEWPIDHPMAGSVPVAALRRIAQWLG
jgi:pimeloyl-ACP methyl ester carboxylesterase